MPADSSFVRVRLGPFDFACHDEAMLRATYAEIFTEQVYRFETATPAPRIIDAGANLGVATCYFKSLYPAAHIAALEPDPRMAALLKRNIEENHLDQVRIFPCALAGQAGRARLHGDLADSAPHALGNSLVAAWGLQQATSAGVEVATLPLSIFLTRPVDLLKLDVEGMELEVLRESEALLPRVREIRLEVHQTAQTPGVLDGITTLLQRAGFTLRTEPRPLWEILPEAARPWFQHVKPEIFVVSAARKQ